MIALILANLAPWFFVPPPCLPEIYDLGDGTALIALCNDWWLEGVEPEGEDLPDEDPSDASEPLVDWPSGP